LRFNDDVKFKLLSLQSQFLNQSIAAFLKKVNFFNVHISKDNVSLSTILLSYGISTNYVYEVN